MSDSHEDVGALPKLLTGSRGTVFSLLVLTGVAQAIAAGATVFALSRGLTASTAQGRVLAVLSLLVLAAGVGWLRYNERFLAERLGQDYVHEIRMGLVRHSLNGHKNGSLGATLTRASNDLTAVRNWVNRRLLYIGGSNVTVTGLSLPGAADTASSRRRLVSDARAVSRCSGLT